MTSYLFSYRMKPFQNRSTLKGEFAPVVLQEQILSFQSRPSLRKEATSENCGVVYPKSVPIQLK